MPDEIVTKCARISGPLEAIVAVEIRVMQVNEDKPYDEINITPMLDLAYVLLVIFILMTTATVQGLKASLPRATNSAKPAKESKVKAIAVDNAGRTFLEGNPVALQDLEVKLKAFKLKDPDLPVVIRGDSATPYQSILDVLDVVNQLGITQRGLATKPRS
ncbi:MAG TPA: biopolymer transporter ExbD [Verrucomicrobiales bacterium]|nr:biopolymer transporter ExbD [Verrucomicrobiales bacterium]